MAALSAPASAASCASTAGDDTCVIDLTSSADTHDGGAQTTGDKLEFTSAGGWVYNASSFIATNAGQFRNYETAQVNAGASLTINDTATTLVNGADTTLVSNINWTVDGQLVLNFASTADSNDTIGNTSSVTISGTGALDVWEDETIGALTVNGIASLFNTTKLTASSLSGSGIVNLGGTSTLIAGSTSSVFTGQLNGTGGFTKIGGGTLELNSDNAFTGLLTVSAGILEIGHAGAVDNASGVTVTGGTLSGETAYSINGPVTITTANALSRITGNVTINGDVSSNGGLQPGNTAPDPISTIDNPGQEMGTITINGNYTSTGSNAYVGMFVNLDAALAAPVNGTTQDFLDIQGNITGNNRTMLSHLSILSNPTGGATTGNGIQLVRITGTNSGNDFYQATAITAGAYQYLLTYVPNYSGSDDGYFLQSAARDELFAHAAMLSAGQEIVRNCYHDGQRIPDSPKGATYGRAWVGYRQGSTDFGADTGIESNVDFSCTTGGMDWRMGNGWFGGISGGFGDTEGNILTPAGVGNYTGSGRAAEVFASFTSEALFINLSAGYNAMDYTFDGRYSAPIMADTAGLLARAETGVALDLDAIAVKLIGAVSYDGTSCDDSCLGVAVSEDTGLLEAKGTVRIDGVAHGGSVRPWIAASFSDVLSDGINTVSMGAVSVSHDTSGQRLSLDAGLQAYLDQNFALYLDGGYQESLATDVTGYKAGIGLKMYW